MTAPTAPPVMKEPDTETLEPSEAASPNAVPPGAPAAPPQAAPHAAAPEPEEPDYLRHLAADHDEDEGFFEKHRVKIIIAAVVILGGAIVLVALNTKSEPARKAPERLVSIQLPPPPPPPLPPPPPKIQPPPPPEQKMIEQTPVEDEPKPEPKPVDEPPPAMGTAIKGNGPGDGFGLSGTGKGGGIGGLGGNGGRAASKWGWYAGQVQSRIADALRQNKKTRAASISGLQVRVWPDATGRITRAQLAGSTGDRALDAALQSEVLTGLQLSEPPPAGMPAPIVLRLTARRP